MTVAIISGHFHAPILVGIGTALAFGAIVGFINGLLVNRTAVPSFIVTLGTLFAVAGLTLGLSVILTGTTSVAIRAGPEAKFLLGQFIGGAFQVTIFWWIAVAIFFGFILHYSPDRNWIFAMGGDKVSARNAGIPTQRLTILLFMCSDMSAAFVGVSQAILYNSAQVSAGQSEYFQCHYLGRRRGRASDRRIWLGVRHCARHADLRHRQPRHLLHRFDANWASLIIGILLLLAVLMNNTFRRLALAHSPAKGKPKK